MTILVAVLKSRKETLCPLDKPCPEIQKVANEYYKINVLPVLTQNSKEFQKCYSTYSSIQRKILIGNIEVIFKVEENGRILSVKIANNDFKNQNLADCISTKLQNIQLPPPPLEINRNLIHRFFFESKRKIKKTKTKIKINKNKKKIKEIDGMKLLPMYLPMR